MEQVYEKKLPALKIVNIFSPATQHPDKTFTLKISQTKLFLRTASKSPFQDYLKSRYS